MRLTQSQRQVIVDTGKQHCGEGCEIWLFGSRVDDSRKGGDIDLMVSPAKNARVLPSYRVIDMVKALAIIEEQVSKKVSHFRS